MMNFFINLVDIESVIVFICYEFRIFINVIVGYGEMV